MKTLRIILSATVIMGFISCKEHPTETDLYNVSATPPAAFNPVKEGLKPVNEVINPSKNTMAILYANASGYKALLTQPVVLQKDAVLELVTWQRKSDPHWFGVNIPGKFLSIEIVKTSQIGNQLISNYQRLKGNAMTPDVDTSANKSREKFILALRQAVMP